MKREGSYTEHTKSQMIPRNTSFVLQFNRSISLRHPLPPPLFLLSRPFLILLVGVSIISIPFSLPSLFSPPPLFLTSPSQSRSGSRHGVHPFPIIITPRGCASFIVVRILWIGRSISFRTRRVAVASDMDTVVSHLATLKNSGRLVGASIIMMIGMEVISHCSVAFNGNCNSSSLAQSYAYWLSMFPY